MVKHVSRRQCLRKFFFWKYCWHAWTRWGSHRLFVRPSDFEESTVLISLCSICARMAVLVWVCSFWREPMIKISALATLQLSLLTLNHVLTLASALLIISSKSLVVEVAKLILVSSVYIRALHSFKDLDKSFIYNRKSNEPWGTHQVIWLSFGKWLFTLHCWVPWDK